MAGNPREAALLTLYSCDRQGAWSDLALSKQIRAHELDGRDAAFATKLCFGLLQNRLLCDFYLQKFSNIPLERMENKVLNILRLAIYQMIFLTRVPQSAAVNEAVKLAKKHSKNPRSAAFVNGILRAVGRNLDHLPAVEAHDPIVGLSIRYSHPEWLVRAFSQVLPLGELEALLEADNQQPPTCAQVNTLRFTAQQTAGALAGEGMAVTPHPWLPDCLLLAETGDLTQSPSFQTGAFYIQDTAARLAVMAADPKPGMRVLDACAAPGGKSFAAAISMGGSGEIFSCDIHPHKQKLIDGGAYRLGLDCIRSAVSDAKVRQPSWEGTFDLVLADVPCSGLGIIRKKPDIRYKAPEPLEGLPAVQYDILDNVSYYVKPGGGLLYSTCTLLQKENEEVISRFLAQHSDYELESFVLPEPIGLVEAGQLTLWPHRHGTDGFYLAKLRRLP